MNRITAKDLERLCDRLNHKTGNPLKPWQTDDTGKMTANIGNYHISGAYGGVCLHQMANTHGGVNTLLSGGYSTKRELWNEMNAYLSGITCAQDKSA